MALFGSASAYKVDVAPLDCINEGYTFILGTNSTDYLVAPFVPDFTQGFCCDEFGDMDRFGRAPQDPDGICNDRCEGQNDAFCIGNPDNINNRFLMQFLTPSNADMCPTDGNILTITQSDVPLETLYNFPGVVPNQETNDWHCKWKISADWSLLHQGTSGSIEDRAANGWLVVEPVSNGFDREVVVVMQPQDKFYDFNYRDPTNNSYKQSFVGLSRNGNKYVIPAEFDVYLDVSPYRRISDEVSTEGEGSISFTVYHTLVNPTPDSEDRTWTNVEREGVPITPEECVDDMRFSDQAGDDCTWYSQRPMDCGKFDSKYFTAEHACCACKIGECISTTQTDRAGDDCKWYGEHQNACGWFPTPDFNSGTDCCECGAGCYDSEKIDALRQPCSWYQANKDKCGMYDSSGFFADWDCCACRLRGCVDSTGRDSGGDTCAWYDENLTACGYWDTDTFLAERDCCSCARQRSRRGRTNVHEDYRPVDPNDNFDADQYNPLNNQ